MISFLQSNMTLWVTTGTLLINILFVAFIISLLDKGWRNKVIFFIEKYVLEIIFVFSFLALVGSIAYSNIMDFPPCELCWIQRIFMFPLPILAFIAILKKDKKIVSYLLPLVVLGTIVSFYHSLSNWGFGGSVLPCTAAGGECSKLYVLEYGYITIPFMAFTSFVLILTTIVIHLKSSK